MSIKQRLIKLEEKDSVGGLVVIKLYPDTTKEQALSQAGINPKPNDLIIVLHKPDPASIEKPKPRPPVIIKETKEAPKV